MFNLDLYQEQKSSKVRYLTYTKGTDLCSTVEANKETKFLKLFFCCWKELAYFLSENLIASSRLNTCARLKISSINKLKRNLQTKESESKYKGTRVCTFFYVHLPARAVVVERTK